MLFLANFFLDGRNVVKARIVAWIALFLAILAIMYKFALWEVSSELRRQNKAALAHVSQSHESAISALQALRADATAPPCSEAFLQQMRVIAYRPDGLNLFFFAPGATPKCGTNQTTYPAAHAFGDPDVLGAPSEPNLWINRDLQGLGLPGVFGTIAVLGSFGVVIPPHPAVNAPTGVTNTEIVIRATSGKSISFAGRPGLLSHAAKFENGLGVSPTVVEASCDARNVYCIASVGNLASWFAGRRPLVILLTLLAATLAWFCADALVRALMRFWSFEARFARNLDENTIVLAYQPIIDLKTGRTSGCEVLARWRDIDGSIVSPSKFIGLVRQSGRTLELTKLITTRAFVELTQQLPRAVLQINFNVFACDFDAPALLPLFSAFLVPEQSFKVAVELVEDEAIDYAKAQSTIEQLRKSGIKTYIDDFGTGYSSIERVATLTADGVKLDRSFAMSAPDSVLGRMFEQVLHLASASGNIIVVEGVESEARLQLLRETGLVQYVQGYVFSRPVAVSEFVAFLAARNELPLAAQAASAAA